MFGFGFRILGCGLFVCSNYIVGCDKVYQDHYGYRQLFFRYMLGDVSSGNWENG